MATSTLTSKRANFYAKGFKLEYSDSRCHTSLSFAALTSVTCDASWEPSFVPLDNGSGLPFAIRRELEIECLQFQMMSIRTEANPKDEFERMFPTISGLNLRIQLFACTGGDSPHADAKAFEVDVSI